MALPLLETERLSFRLMSEADEADLERLDSDPQGRAGLHRMDDGEVEVGYLFLKEHWGQGCASEALRGLLGWAREALPAHAVPSRRILAFAPTHHHASLRVMEKCAGGELPRPGPERG